MWAMIYDDGFRYTKLSDDVIKEKSSNAFDIVWIGWHGFSLLCEIVNNHNDVVMVDCEQRLASHKINTSFWEWDDRNYEVE